MLDDIKKWLDNNINATAKGGKTHQAMQYLLSQWPKMVVYCEDGRLNISNAAAENAIRPFVIGKKDGCLPIALKEQKPAPLTIA